MVLLKINLYWVFVIIIFALFGAISTPDKNNTYQRISDQKAEIDSSWRTIELPRYDHKRSIFTNRIGANAVFPLSQMTVVTELSLRVYSYGKSQNTIAIYAGNQKSILTFGNGHKGLMRITTKFASPVEAVSIKIATVKIGQDTFVLDSVIVKTVNQKDWMRISARAAMMALLAASIWIASLLVVVPATSSGRTYVSIDLFRGIAVLVVILLHSTGYAALPDLSSQSPFDLLVKNGHFGVELFYIVSAFTLTYSLFALSSRGNGAGEMRVGTFWYRRFTRIYPTFLAVLILTLAYRYFTDSGAAEISYGEIFYRYFTMSYIFDREILTAPIHHTVWWSISTEFQFYILMPLVVLPLTDILVSRKTATGVLAGKNRVVFALGVVVLSVLLSAYTRDQLSGKPWLVYTLFYHLDAFIMGVGLAIVMWHPKTQKTEEPRPFIQNRIWSWAGSLLFLLLILCITYSDEIATVIRLDKAFVPTRLVVISTAAICLLAVKECESRNAQFIPMLWLRPIGLLSFLLYLLHVPALQFVQNYGSPSVFGTEADYYLWTFCAGASLSLFLAVILHRVVEVPALKMNAVVKKHPWMATAAGLTIGVIIVQFLISLAAN